MLPKKCMYRFVSVDSEEDFIQICHLLSRNGKLSLVRPTKSFPTIPNLIGIVNANQNEERFKMWSVMLLCTISQPLKVMALASRLAGPDNAVPSLPGSDSRLSKKKQK